MATTEQAIRVGYVYIMTNPAMPGLVKIGSTTLLRTSPPTFQQHRSASSLSVHPFEDELRAERALQSVLREYRVNSGREFYDVPVEQAREALLQLSNEKVPPTASPLSVPPNVSATAAQDEKSASNTNASVLGFPYWTRFNEMRVKEQLLPRFENAGPRFFHRYFLVRPSQRNGKRNIHYEGRIRINSPQVSMRLIFKTANNIKELFDQIAQDRGQIEQEIGFRLLWDRERGRQESHVAIERDDMDPRDFGEWTAQHAWLSRIVSAFEGVIRPRIAKLPSPTKG
jgi:hypothetical protein